MAVPGSFRKKLVLSMGIGGIAFLVLALLPDRTEILSAAKTFEWKWMPAALGLALVNYAIRALRWHWYLRHLGLPVPVRESLPIFLIGLMLSVTPGKAGELFKAYLVKLARGVPMSRTASVVVVERLTDMTGMLILVIPGLLVLRVRNGLVLSLLGIILGGLFLLSSQRFMEKMIRISDRFVSERMKGRIHTAYASLSSLLCFRPLVGGTLLSTAAWFAECLSLLVIVLGFKTQITVLVATFVYSLSTLAGAALFFMPGGIGGTEASMVLLLREIAGTNTAVASLSTVLVRAATLWFAVVIGLTSLSFCPLEVSENFEKTVGEEPTDTGTVR